MASPAGGHGPSSPAARARGSSLPASSVDAACGSGPGSAAAAAASGSSLDPVGGMPHGKSHARMRAELGLPPLTVSYTRFDEVYWGLYHAMREMQETAKELRSLSNEHRIPNLQYVHVEVVNHMCKRIDEIAATLDITSLNLDSCLFGPSSPSDLDDLTVNDDFELDEWEWMEENSVDSEEIHDRRM